MRKDPVRLAIHVAVYVILFILFTTVFGWVLIGADNLYLAGSLATLLLSSLLTNWLVLRIYESRGLLTLGLWWSRASSENLLIGVAGGIGSAIAVLLPPIIFRVAHFTPAR